MKTRFAVTHSDEKERVSGHTMSLPSHPNAFYRGSLPGPRKNSASQFNT